MSFLRIGLENGKEIHCPQVTWQKARQKTNSHLLNQLNILTYQTLCQSFIFNLIEVSAINKVSTSSLIEYFNLDTG